MFLGLNTAAQGLQKMSPNISQGFFGFASNNQVWTVTALGKEYQWDAGETLAALNYFKDQAGTSADQAAKSLAFWSDLLIEKGKIYLPYWEEKFRQLFVSQNR